MVAPIYGNLKLPKSCTELLVHYTRLIADLRETDGMKVKAVWIIILSSYSELTQSIEVMGFASIEETAGPVVF